jgi:hypothetical protein
VDVPCPSFPILRLKAQTFSQEKPENQKPASANLGRAFGPNQSGGDLLFHAASGAELSALRGSASVFGITHLNFHFSDDSFRANFTP